MKVIGINASPRKVGNSVKLLAKALEGASSAGYETKQVNLYDLKFTSCRECFACKRLTVPTFGKCTWPDDLKPALEEIRSEGAALIVATPVFFLDFPGTTRSFFERLIFPAFPYSDYNDEKASLFPRRMPVGVIVDMNVDEATATKFNYPTKIWSKESFGTIGDWCQHFIGPYEALPVYDTWQFPDYSKYASSMFDAVHKAKVRDEQFPKDLDRAYAFGKAIVAKI